MVTVSHPIRDLPRELASARERVRLLLVQRDDPDLDAAGRAVLDAGELRVAQAVVARLESA